MSDEGVWRNRCVLHGDADAERRRSLDPNVQVLQMRPPLERVELSWAQAARLAPKQLLWLGGFRHSTRQPEPVILCPSPPAAVLFRFVALLRITYSYMMWYAYRWMHLFAQNMMSRSLSLMLISTASHRIALFLSKFTSISPSILFIMYFTNATWAWTLKKASSV